MTLRHSSTVVSQVVALAPAMPALLTRMSILPNAFSVASRAASTGASSDTSHANSLHRLADLLRRLLGERGVAIPDRDLGAGGDEPLGDGAADALRATGDDRDAAREIDIVHGQAPLRIL